jgi:hypothetical protein
MLTHSELVRIFSWLPYRDDWPIDRNRKHDGIEEHYGELINDFNNSNIFNSTLTENGGMSNYLEYLCHPPVGKSYSGPCILVLISLCAPIATFGQTTCTINQDNIVHGHNYFQAKDCGIITSPSLKSIELELKNILKKHPIILLDKDFLSQALPKEIADSLEANLDNKYIDGIFQRAN